MRTTKTLDAIRAQAWVSAVDDERQDGNSIIVTLCDGYEFRENPGCGVQGFDTVAAARNGTSRHAIVELASA